MSLTLTIKRTGQGSFTDYTSYVYASKGDDLAVKRHVFNTPQELTVLLKEASGFVAPERHNQIRLDSSSLFSPSGQIFTGYIVNDPEKSLHGVDSDGQPRWIWSLRCLSEEYLCDLVAPREFHRLPPFQNMTAGAIVSGLVTLLASSMISASGVQAGPLIPYFEVSRDESFTQAVQRLCDGVAMRFWTRRGVAYLAPIDDVSLGKDCVQTDADFDPENVVITPQSSPVYNDVVAVGISEPRTYVREYFSGDGLTMRFPLAQPVYGVEEVKILEDTFTNSGGIDPGVWTENDPSDNIQAGPSLFVEGGLGVNQTKLVAKGGVEMGGTLLFQHGAVRFTSASSGIIGGLLTAPTEVSLSGCFFGYSLEATGAQTSLKAVVNGGSPSNYILMSNNNTGGGLPGWANIELTVTQASGVLDPYGGAGPVFLVTPGASTLNAAAIGFYAEELPEGTPFCGSVWLRAQSATGAGPRLRLTKNSFSHAVSVFDTTLKTQWEQCAVSGYYTSGGLPSGAVRGIGLSIGGDSTVTSGTVPFYYCFPQINWGWGVTPHASTASSGVSIKKEVRLNTVAGKDYILQMLFQAPERARYVRSFHSLATPSGYSGYAVSSKAWSSFKVLELDQNDPSATPTGTELCNVTVDKVPSFLTYVPYASDDLNVAANFLFLTRPIDVLVLTRPPSATGFTTKTVGFEKEIDKDATIVAGAQDRSDLGFFGDVAPSAGEIVEVRYRTAGAGQIRVINPSSVAAEAARMGDSGVRAAILPDLKFSPRNEAEAELAVKAYIDDHTSPVYDGAFLIQGIKGALSREPVPGRFFTVNVSGAHPSFSAFAREVTTRVKTEARDGTEYVDHEVKFGPVLRFDQAVAQFSAQSTPSDSNKKIERPVAIDFSSRVSMFASSVPGFSWDYTKSATGYGVDFGQAPPTGRFGHAGHFEVRYSDEHWGVPGSPNLIAEVTGQAATLLRSNRKQSYWVRGVEPRNFALHSGFEDGVNYAFDGAGAQNPVTGSWDGSRGYDDFGAQKFVYSYPASAFPNNSGIIKLTNTSGVATVAGTGQVWGVRVSLKLSRVPSGTEGINLRLFSGNSSQGQFSFPSLSGVVSNWVEVTGKATIATSGTLCIGIANNFNAPVTGWLDNVQIERLEATGSSLSPFYRTEDKHKGPVSRYSSLVQINFPMPPSYAPALSAYFDSDANGRSLIRAAVSASESQIRDMHELELRDSDDATVLARWDLLTLSYENGYYVGRHAVDNSVTLTRSKNFFAYQRNSLGEYGPSVSANAAQVQPAKPWLTLGDSVGPIVEIVMASLANNDIIVETEVQAIAPGVTGFGSPSVDVLLPGFPEKFAMACSATGDWSFRARRRDVIGWSPWSSEAQGAFGAQVVIYSVSSLQATHLDPTVGATVNQQNFLANADFFIRGITGQEGTGSAKYFSLVRANTDGSECGHDQAMNEMRWASGVNFAQADPGFRSAYLDLGKTLNPGERCMFSVSLRHDGAGSFARNVKMSIVSPSTSSYNQTKTVTGGIISSYRWFSAAFALPTGSQVPSDLNVQVEVVCPAGSSLASNLKADKAIFNRGHRQAAFSFSLWDVVAPTWNATGSGYNLPAGLLAEAPRTQDAGGAGDLMGTGTEEEDPGFPERYYSVSN